MLAATVIATCPGAGCGGTTSAVACARRVGAVGAEDRGDREFGARRQVDQVGRVDAERGGDAVEPADRDGARAGLEPADGLRRGRRLAALGDIVEGHPLARRTSRMRVIIGCSSSEPIWFFHCPTDSPLWQARLRLGETETAMASTQATAGGARRSSRGVPARRARPRRRPRPARSVTVNLAESPLGWLFARGHVSRRQFDAGERLRGDWERGAAGAAGDDALGRGAGRARPRRRERRRPTSAARRSTRGAGSTRRSPRAGPGLADILWRIVCAGEGMRDAETALGWPARAGKLVLTIALDRVADYYRIR